MRNLVLHVSFYFGVLKCLFFLKYFGLETAFLLT